MKGTHRSPLFAVGVALVLTAGLASAIHRASWALLVVGAVLIGRELRRRPRRLS